MCLFRDTEKICHIYQMLKFKKKIKFNLKQQKSHVAKNGQIGTLVLCWREYKLV